MTVHPPCPAAHLNPETFEPAQRHLVAKAIAEFAHERLLVPAPSGDAEADDAWSLTTPDGEQTWRFTARRHALEHWTVDPGSLTRTGAGSPLRIDAQEFIVGFAPLLGLPDALLPTYLEEISSTLASAAYRRHHGTVSAADLVQADFQTIERSMTEGHPGFVANNGRIGFSATEHDAYAPEAGRPVRLVWLAARRSLAHLATSRGLTEEDLYATELTDAERDRFAAVLTERGLDPAAYRWLPVHPWQWEHRISIGFAPDVARGDLVLLGESADTYQAQQSIRTFFNRDRPERHYVKTALAVQNMGFLRGLSPAYMEVTPAINDWVADLVAADDVLAEARFTVLPEVAAIGYTGDAYHRVPSSSSAPSPHRKMIAALWRRSPVPGLADGERLATLASLLHRDADGVSLAAELIRESGLDPHAWVRSLLGAYLLPVAHCLLAHRLAFMPHGENLILVFEQHVPVRAIMKDIGEEVAVLDDRPLPVGIERIRAVVPAQEQELVIHTDVFDGVLRHLGAILAEDGVLDEAAFWAEVAACLDRHRQDHPALHAGLDLFRDRFAHSCLNRLQLRNTLQMVDLTDQAASLQYAGTLVNPIGTAGVAAGVTAAVSDTAAHAGRV